MKFKQNNLRKKYFKFSLLLAFFIFFFQINVSAKESQVIETSFDSFTFSNVGATKNLKVKTSSGLNVTFSSENKSIATIDNNGNITAIKPGTTTIYVTQLGNDQYLSEKKAITVTVPKIKTRNDALQPWFDAMVTQQKWSWNARYDWTRPTIQNSKSMGTCITMPAVSLQRVGLLNPGEYITGSTAIPGHGCDKINSSINVMKKHAGYYEWYTPNGKPKSLISSGTLIPGDLVTIGQHTMVYMGVNKQNNLVWNTSGRTGGSSGNRTAIKKRITYYENKDICFIARIKTYNINTSVINGYIETSNNYMAGQNVTIKYKPQNGAKLKSVIVDGKNVSKNYISGYNFKKLKNNHTIFVIYSKGSSIEDLSSDNLLNKFINSDNNSQKVPSSNNSSSSSSQDLNQNDEEPDQSTENDINPEVDDINAEDTVSFYNNEDYETKNNYKGCDLIPESIIKYLKNFFFLIQVLGIILLIITTLIEFIKVVTTYTDDSFKKAFKNTIKRIIIIIILLILPNLIIWILNIINANAYKTNSAGEYIIGENGDPLCKDSHFSSKSTSNTNNSTKNKSTSDNKTNSPTNNNTKIETNIAKAQITGLAQSYYTTGLSKVNPEPTITLSGKKLQKGYNYSLTCSNNTKPGTATCTLKGKGKYTGSKNLTFKLVNLGDDVARVASLVSYSRAKYYEHGKYPGTTAYLRAWNIAGRPNSDSHPGRTCGAAVATIYRSSGYDRTMSTTATLSLKYLSGSNKWTKIGEYSPKKSPEKNKLVPGDVLVRKGHIWMYLGSKIPKEIYKNEIKGKGVSGGDTGSPKGVWMSAHLLVKGGSAAGIGNAAWALANNNYGRTVYIYRCTKPDDTSHRHGKAVA